MLRPVHKRIIAASLSAIISFQPAATILAQDVANSTITTDEYTLHSNWDGSYTLSFYGNLDFGEETIGSFAEDDDADDLVSSDLSLETTISGSNEEQVVTMEYGDFVISFTPDIYENASPVLREEMTEASLEEEREIKTGSADGSGDESQENSQTETQEVNAPETDMQELETTGIKEETETSTENQTEENPIGEIQITEDANSGNLDEDNTTPVQSETEETETETTEDADSEEDPPQTKASEITIPDSEIRYRKTENGIKEELVIYGYRGGHRVNYDFTLQGLTPVQNGNEIILADAAGTEQAKISAPYLFDAAGHTCYDVAVQVMQISEQDWRISYIPSDAWLRSEERVYPVVLDPTIETTKNTDVEDNYVGDGKDSNTHHNHNASPMYAGNRNGVNYTAFVRPVIPDSVKAIADHILITRADVMLYVSDRTGSGKYEIHQVLDGWKSSTIKGNAIPQISDAAYQIEALPKGTNHIDIKSIVSEWFNNLDQKENCGFAVTGDGTKESWARIESSDQTSSTLNKRVKFTIRYELVDPAKSPNFKAASKGNALGSGTGYVDFSWDLVPYAEDYYIGIFNGSYYEYFRAGNVTSWSTGGKGIWPTDEEIAAGRYTLHHDGNGAELPCIPAYTYQNTGKTAYATSLTYFFRLVPCNSYGQAVTPDLYSGVSCVLPDRISPAQPSAVIVVPSGYTKDPSLSVSWSGIQDFNTASASISNTLGSGTVQYAIDDSDDYQITGINTASGTASVDVSSLSDGEHVIYIRGVDAEGNTGAPKGISFFLDRTGPEGANLQVTPETWTKADTAYLSWSGIEDLNDIAKIEIRVSNIEKEGEWEDTGITKGSYAGYTVALSSLTNGEHEIQLRAADVLGNMGEPVSITVKVDRTAPVVDRFTLTPEGWTDAENVTLAWEDAEDTASGIAYLEYWLNGTWNKLSQSGKNGAETIAVNDLFDGTYLIRLRAVDRAGNVSKEKTVTLMRDTGSSASRDEEDETVISHLITEPDRSEQALPAIRTTSACDIGNVQWHGGSPDLRECEEGAAILVKGGYVDEEGKLHLIGASSAHRETLFEEDIRFAEGTIQTDPLQAEAPFDAILLEASTRGGDGSFSYSLDGTIWMEMKPGIPIILSEEQTVIQLRAQMGEGEKLADWKLTGYSISPAQITANLVREPEGVTAAVSPGKQVTLKWNDPQGEDPTAESILTWNVYRNGTLLATTSEQTYTDPVYLEDAVYEVSAVRTYNEGTYAIRESERITAQTVIIRENTKKSTPTVEGKKAAREVRQVTQSAALTSLYGGNQTFVIHESAPAAGVKLDQSLLGKSQYCSLGFEPVNFNTGNYVLEALDYTYHTGAGELRFLRTYNSQSNETDGLFGMHWSSPIGQYLLSYDDGSIGWRKADGALAVFSPSGDDSFSCEETRDQLEKTTSGFRAREEDGSVWTFSSEGLLMAASLEGGHIEIQRNQNKADRKYGVPEAVVLPGEEIIQLTTDDNGHVTGMVLPDETSITYEYLGKTLTRVTNASGEVTSYTYGENAALLTWTSPDGTVQVSNTYDAQGRVTFQTDADGGEYHLTYFADHTLLQDAEGITSEVWIDGRKRTVKEIDGNGSEVLYAYDAQGQLAGKTDPTGKLTTWTYDEDGNRTETTLPDGTVLTSVYDASGNVVEETDALGNQTSYSYDEAGRVTEITYPDGSLENRAYDENGNVLCITKSDAGSTTYTYDDAGRILTQTDSLGNSETFTCDVHGNQTSWIDKAGHLTTYTYDANGNIVMEVKPDGGILRRVYDANGLLLSETDAEGNETSYEYDSLRNCIAIHYPDGGKKTFGYDADGNRIWEEDPLGNRSLYTYDRAGNLLSETDPLGRITLYEYDANGLMTGMTLPSGAQETYAYDPVTGLLLRTTNAAGTEIMFTYDAVGNITSISGSEGCIEQYTYDAMGRIIETKDALGNTTADTYNLAGRLISETDPMGNTTTYAYDTEGNLSSVTDARERTTQYAYDALGQRISQTDSRGAVTQWTYDAAGNVTTETDPLGRTTTWTYDQNGNLLAQTDPAGAVTRYQYDSMGRCIRKINAAGGETSYTYDLAGNLTGEAFPSGGTVSYAYDAAGQKISMRDVLGQTLTIEYDNLGNVSSTNGSGGDCNTYEYNAAGQLIRMVEESGLETTYTYDTEGRLLCEAAGEDVIFYTYDAGGHIIGLTDGSGREAALSYDAAGNLTEVIYPDGTRDEFSYDPAGNLVYVDGHDGTYRLITYDSADHVLSIEENGVRTKYLYDLAGQLTEEITGEVITSYTYDLQGNVTSVIDGTGSEITFAYDLCGNLTEVTMADGSTRRFDYDTEGRLLSETDPSGAATEYTYDAADQLTQVKDTLGGTVSYAYDSLGMIREVTDPNGNQSMFTWDAFGNLLSIEDALGNVTGYAYTEDGKVSSILDAEGKETKVFYDADGNRTQILYPDAATVKNTWDAWGRLSSCENELGKITYTYDAFGNLTRKENDAGEYATYEYDENHQVTAIETKGGTTLYTYDVFGRMASVTDPQGRTTSYTYDALGRRIREESDQRTISYTYDQSGNLIRMEASGSNAYTLEYTYDTRGNILTENRKEDGKETISEYTYDALNRILTYHTSDGEDEAYTYDAAGNMLQKTSSQSTTYMEYNAANQLVSVTDETGDREQLTYDSNGNLIGRRTGETAETYQYDASGRLSSFTGASGQTVTYRYDAEGLLAERMVIDEVTKEGIAQSSENILSDTSSNTTFFYDTTKENAQLLSARSDDGERADYLYAQERIGVLQSSGGGSDYESYSYDVRGSVIGVTQEDGAAETYRYTPFGGISTETTIEAGFYYNGEWYDPAVGGYYLRARFYQEKSMRFLQEDSILGVITETQSWNRYLYVQNNPVAYQDPSGKFLVTALPVVTVLAGASKIANTLRSDSFWNKTEAKVIKTTRTLANNLKTGIKTAVAKTGLSNTAFGKAVMSLGNQLALRLTEAQRKAVTAARKIFQSVASATYAGIQNINTALTKACEAYVEKVADDDFLFRHNH